MSRKIKTGEFVPGQGYTKADWDGLDSPPATDEQLAAAKPFADVFPDLAERMGKGAESR